MAESGLINVRTDLADFTHEVLRAVTAHSIVSKLGTDWRVVIERNGRPAAEIRRTRDAGVLVGFYGDVVPEDQSSEQSTNTPPSAATGEKR